MTGGVGYMSLEPSLFPLLWAGNSFGMSCVNACVHICMSSYLNI